MLLDNILLILFNICKVHLNKIEFIQYKIATLCKH